MAYVKAYSVQAAEFQAWAEDQIEPLVEQCESAAETLGVDGPLGSMPTKPDDQEVSGSWVARTALSQQPSLFVDMSDTAQFQAQNGQTTPGIRMDADVVGDELQLECLFVGVLGMVAFTGIIARLGSVVAGRGRVTAGGGVNAGVIAALTPVEPELGGATARTDAGACLINVRQNGTVTVTQRDAFTAFVGASITSGACDAFNEGDEVEWALEYSGDDDTEAVLKLVIAGAVQPNRTITGLPSACWVGGGIRSNNSGTIGMVTEVAAFAPSLDVVRRAFLVEGAADGGDGSAEAPFNSPAQVRRAILRDFTRSDWRLSVLGYHEDAEIAWDSTLARSVVVEGVIGAECVLDGSVPIEGPWTQIGSSPVWHAPHPGYPGNTTYGGVIWQDEDASQTFGRTGSLTIDGRFSFGRMAANTADDDADFEPGLSTVHNTGDYAGEVLIRMPDDSDPNDATGLRFSRRGSALSVKPSDPAGLNACKVDARDVDLRNTFLACGWFELVHATLAGLTLNGGQGYGLEVNHSSGTADKCVANGTMFDSFHASGEGTAPADPAGFTFNDCVGNGSGYFPSIVLVGDIWSNHRGPENPWTINRGIGRAPGKSVIASPGGITVDGLEASDAWDAAVQIFAQEGLGQQRATLGRLRASTSLYGVVATSSPGQTGIDLLITIDDGEFDSNATASMFAFRAEVGVGTIAIAARNVRGIGSTPSDGHKKTSGGGTISVETQTAIT